MEILKESSHSSSKSQLRDEMEHRTCLDGESDAVELGRKNLLLRKETTDSDAIIDNSNQTMRYQLKLLVTESMQTRQMMVPLGKFLILKIWN